MPYCTSANHQLFFREHHERRNQEPLLLILAGQTSSSAHHSGELAFFGQNHYAVAADFWGTGQSDRLADWPDDWWEQAAHDMAALVEHLGVERYIAVGTSGGGIVALLLAILYPEQVHAVIADSCVEFHPPEVLRQEVRARAQLTPENVAFWRQAHGNDWEQVVAADSSLLLRLAEQGGRAPFSGRLEEIRCPVLLTASLRDGLLFEPGRQITAMAEQIRGSRVFLSSEGDHPLMWSRPGDFRRVARCFLEQMVGS